MGTAKPGSQGVGKLVFILPVLAILLIGLFSCRGTVKEEPKAQPPPSAVRGAATGVLKDALSVGGSIIPGEVSPDTATKAREALKGVEVKPSKDVTRKDAGKEIRAQEGQEPKQCPESP